MKKYLLLIFSFQFLVFIQPAVLGQGCSDAGFCTMHQIKPELKDSAMSNDNPFKAGISYGVAQYNVSVVTPYLEYIRNIGHISLSAKLLMGIRSGDYTTTSDVADAIITASWRLSHHW